MKALLQECTDVILVHLLIVLSVRFTGNVNSCYFVCMHTHKLFFVRTVSRTSVRDFSFLIFFSCAIKAEAQTLWPRHITNVSRANRFSLRMKQRCLNYSP